MSVDVGKGLHVGIMLDYLMWVAYAKLVAHARRSSQTRRGDAWLCVLLRF